jgi:hypothetical protein
MYLMPATKSTIRCMPSQIVLTPGSPSPLRAREAAEPGDEPYHFIQLRRFVGRGLLVEDEGGLPFIGLKQHSGIEVRAGAA